jgi:SAM-dependent methyltransferase
VPDAVFADPRLAAIYDAFDGDRHDLDAYLAIIEELDARHVLDVGCGTGSLGAMLAERGYLVTAVDPAEASLEIARAKTTRSVTWIHCEASDVPEIGADIALMTGNVAQVFLTDDSWAATLCAIRAALRQDGHLVFESRRPQARAWEEWAHNTDRSVAAIPGIGRVEQRLEVTEVRLPFVSFRQTYRFDSDGASVTSDSTLRFRTQEELKRSLAMNGFETLEVRQASDRPGKEFVFIARRH